MDSCSLPIGVSALACLIAEKIPDIDDLVFLGSLLSLLGSTLTTIAVIREKCEGNGGEQPLVI